MNKSQAIDQPNTKYTINWYYLLVLGIELSSLDQSNCRLWTAVSTPFSGCMRAREERRGALIDWLIS